MLPDVQLWRILPSAALTCPVARPEERRPQQPIAQPATAIAEVGDRHGRYRNDADKKLLGLSWSAVW